MVNIYRRVACNARTNGENSNFCPMKVISPNWENKLG